MKDDLLPAAACCLLPAIPDASFMALYLYLLSLFISSRSKLIISCLLFLLLLLIIITIIITIITIIIITIIIIIIINHFPAE